MCGVTTGVDFDHRQRRIIETNQIFVESRLDGQCSTLLLIVTDRTTAVAILRPNLTCLRTPQQEPSPGSANVVDRIFSRRPRQLRFLSHHRSLSGYDEPEIPLSSDRFCLIYTDLGQSGAWSDFGTRYPAPATVQSLSKACTRGQGAFWPHRPASRCIRSREHSLMPGNWRHGPIPSIRRGQERIRNDLSRYPLALNILNAPRFRLTSFEFTDSC